MNLQDWYERGITKEEYMADLDTHREAFLYIYENFEVPEIDMQALQEKDNVRALVLAEAWCGHCMLNIPIFLKFCESGNVPVRFLRRDENLELMDQYLTNEKRYIPIFIFIDENGNQIAKWGPWAPEVKAFADELKKDLPAKDAPNFKEAFRKYADEVGATFKNDQTFWNYAYNSIKTSIL